MRRRKQEITDKRILEDILSGSQICRIAMMDNDRPYLLPFNYGYQRGYIYIHCATKGKKTDLLKRNNIICFEIEQLARIERFVRASDWTTTYRSIVGYGQVEILTDSKLKREGLNIIMRHNGAGEDIDLSYAQHHIDSMLILKIRITEMTGKQSENWNKRQME